MRHSIYRAKARVLSVAVAAICAQQASAQEAHTPELIDEIIVTSSLQQTRAETALPVNVLTGEELREKAASTLGETLKELVGVNSASFGTGVGLPIIRGQSGNRVQVLQGGVSNMDASAISPDHANSVEAVVERPNIRCSRERAHRCVVDAPPSFAAGRHRSGAVHRQRGLNGLGLATANLEAAVKDRALDEQIRRLDGERLKEEDVVQ